MKASPLSPALHLANQIKLKQSQQKNSTELKNKTQKTAFALLQREERNAVRSRLECLLVQQFMGKYGSKNPDSDINRNIRATIKKFVNSYEDVRDAEAAIGKLEIEVQNSVSSARLAIQQAKIARQNSAMEKRVPALNQSGKSTPVDGNMIDLDENQINQWPIINAIMSIEAEQKQKQDQEKLRQKKLKYQAELSEQIQANKNQHERQTNAKMTEKEKIEKELSSFEADQIAARLKKQEDQRREREMREAQILERKKVKEEERRARIAQEQGEMARAKRIAEEEEEYRRQEKMRQKQAQDALKEENEYNKRVKMEALLQQQQYETKLNAEYEKKLAKEEEARANAFKARMDALASFSKSYESRVGVRLQQQKIEDDRLITATIEESDRKRVERERQDFERRRQMALQDAEYNIKMMEQKKKAADDERLDAIRRRKEMEFEAMEQKRKEREAAEAKRVHMLELKQNLDQQVTLRHKGDSNFSNLSNVEATMNKSIIKKLQEDPELRHKIVEKVIPQSSRSTGTVPMSRASGNRLF